MFQTWIDFLLQKTLQLINILKCNPIAIVLSLFKAYFLKAATKILPAEIRLNNLNHRFVFELDLIINLIYCKQSFTTRVIYTGWTV